MGIAFHLCERVLVIAEQQCYFACGPANLIDEIRDERISQCRLKENRDEVLPHTNSPGPGTRSSSVVDMLMQTTCLQHMAFTIRKQCLFWCPVRFIDIFDRTGGCLVKHIYVWKDDWCLGWILVDIVYDGAKLQWKQVVAGMDDDFFADITHDILMLHRTSGKTLTATSALLIHFYYG